MGRHIFAAAVLFGLGLFSGIAGAGPPAPPGQSPPSNTAPPSLSGTMTPGEKALASPGTWSGPSATLAYQWLRCDAAGAECGPLETETFQTYLITPEDVGATLRVLVLATNKNGSTGATSDPSEGVSDKPSEPPNEDPAPPDEDPAPPDEDPAPPDEDPAPPDTSRELALSGFDASTAIDGMSSSARNQTLYFHGVDGDTGFDWDAGRFYGDRWRTTGIICGSSCPTGGSSDYYTARLENVTGPYGTSTRALKFGLLKKSPTTDVAQVFIESSSLTSAVKDYYARYWIRLNPELLNQANSQGNGYWRMFWEYKTWSDYRMKIYIMNHRSGGPHWYIQADNGGWSFQGTPTTFWSHNSEAKVPLDQWFHVEIYHHRATDSSGRFFFAVNGQRIVDQYGSNYGANRDEIAIMAHSVVYSSLQSNAYQWVDDFEVRERPPCASLPCGARPPRSLS